MTKPYRIVAKIKNNRLWSAIRMTFPDVVTQSDAARELKLSPTELGKLLNLNWWPHAKPKGQITPAEDAWYPIAWKIANALRSTPDYLFDGELYGRKAKPIAFEVSAHQLADVGLLSLSPAPDDALFALERKVAVDDALAALTKRQRDVLTRRFGLDGEPEQTLAEVGATLGLGETKRWNAKASVSVERVRGIEAQALRRLRHPRLRRRLREVSDETETR